MAKKTAGWLLIGLCCLIFFSPETGTASIGHIKEFLNTCPQNDPAYNQIRNDFIIRRNGVVVGDIPCTEPTSSLNIAQYSDELIVLQGLRAIYYMDYGQAGHLPWTTGTLYQWMKSKIGGINIDDFAGSSWCCQNFGESSISWPRPRTPRSGITTATGKTSPVISAFTLTRSVTWTGSATLPVVFIPGATRPSTRPTSPPSASSGG